MKKKQNKPKFVQKMMQEYRRKGGTDSRVVKEILSGENEDIIIFLTSIIREYDDLSSLPFSALVELNNPNSEDFDIEQIKQQIYDSFSKPNDRVKNKREPVLQSPKLKILPALNKDYTTEARKQVEGIITCFTSGTITNREMLKKTEGEKDIPLIDFLEYLYSDERVCINKAIE